ncbi:MAG: chromosomal replication initiator protein DnaA, partial [Betaproteobacteria bacterium]|nr:chromosomal replication initiator protein DnaA [Betaproteobacteria bacterium]
MPEGTPSEILPDAGQALWQACLDELSRELPEQQFNTWIKPLSAQVNDALDKVTLFVANRFKMDWVRAQYAQKLSQTLERLQGQPIQIELALTPREAPVRAARQPATTLSPSAPEALDMPEEPASAAFRSRLNPSLTFDTLVEGSANRMARAAAMHVAGSPGHLYNPLFI